MRVLLFFCAVLLTGCATTQPDPDLDRLLSAEAASDHLTPPPLDYQRLERALLSEVNHVRSQHGLHPLPEMPQLASAAQRHSERMSREAFFAHTRDGRDAGQRAGGRERDLGENLYLAHRYSSYERVLRDGQVDYIVDWRSEEEIARHAVVLWLESPSHRANLLSLVYGGQAIGVATGQGATVFITQSLAPR
jgi:uncharacterized protein YkwD